MANEKDYRNQWERSAESGRSEEQRTPQGEPTPHAGQSPQADPQPQTSPQAANTKIPRAETANTQIPHAEAPYTQIPRAEEPYTQAPPQPPADGGSSGRGSRTWKIFAGVGGFFLAALAVTTLIGIVGFTLIMASCVASCSDAPIRDSKEVSRFIESQQATDRDLATFDALRGCFESLHDSLAIELARGGDDGTGEDVHEKLMTVDEVRTTIAEGTWPKKLTGYGATSSATSPQLWVRLAELSEDAIEEETGEDWEIVDFAYPFPHSAALPIAKREEGDRVRTLLICRSGEDEGLYVTVNYWRWAEPAHFEVRIDGARERHESLARTYAALSETEALSGRRFLFDGFEVFIWELEGDDPLRDPDTFVEFANEAVEIVGDSTYFNLVRNDTPFMIVWDNFSMDYPNHREVEELPFEQARDLLLISGGNRSFDNAREDLLLSVFCSENGGCDTSDLRGVLATDNERWDSIAWSKPNYGCIFDSSLEEAARDYLGCTSSQPMIVLSSVTTRGEESKEVFLDTWVIVGRGVFSETPEEFCDEVNGLRDSLWGAFIDAPEGDQRRDLSLQVVVIDEGSIIEGNDEGGETRTFDELALALREDMGCLDSYSFDVLLEGYSSLSQWNEEWRLNRYDLFPNEVDGKIARSREWRYGEN